MDETARPGPGRLPPEVLRPLLRLDARRALAHVALEWAAIVGAAVACELVRHPALYVAAVVWIGARLHALGIMAHDGAHGLLVPSRRWNDRIAELALAWPVLLSLSRYREIHRLHHRHLNTERDPDWTRNRPDRLATRRGWADFARIMLGLDRRQAGLLRFVGARDASARVPRFVWPVVAVVAAAALAGRLDLLLLYWVVPLFSWFLVAMRLKGTAEHFAVRGGDALGQTRTVLPGPLTRLLVAPKNVHFHLEHHLYPGVPFYRLPALHAALAADPAYRIGAHVTLGYAAFLRECARARRAEV